MEKPKKPKPPKPDSAARIRFEAAVDAAAKSGPIRRKKPKKTA